MIRAFAIGSFVAASLSASASVCLAQTVPSYLQEIVEMNAPLIIQETDAPDHGTRQIRFNHLLRFDFDGDFNGLNQDESASFGPTPKADPAAYYSVVETADAYYIGYYYYHVQDGGTSVADVNLPGHLHDLEGIWEIVEKGALYPFGHMRLALTQAHGAMLPFYDSTSFPNSPPIVGIPGELQAYPVGFIHRWDDGDGVLRPVVAIRASTHGTYMAQSAIGGSLYSQTYGIQPDRQPSDPYTIYPHGNTAVIMYQPEPYCVPQSACTATPLDPATQSGTYFYNLVSLFDDAGAWPLRQTNGEIFAGQNLAYLGGDQWGYLGFYDNSTNLAANPPWQWSGGSGECPINGSSCWYSYSVDNTAESYSRTNWPTFAYGSLLTDPSTVAHDYFPWQNWSSSIIYDPFIGGAGSHPPDLAVGIDGPTTFNEAMQTATFTALVSGGTPPYQYQWSGAATGSDVSVDATVTQSTTLYLDVWDAAGVHVAVSTFLNYCTDGQINC